MKRFEHNANTFKEVQNYYQSRARQLILDGYFWNKQLVEIEGGYSTSFIKDNKSYSSFYILKDYRGKKLAKEAIKCSEPIVTVEDCNIIDFLKNHNKEHVVEGKFNETLEYKAIESFYGDTKAQRNQCYLMNHIDEGLYIIKKFGGSIDAMKAFCVHPIVQNSNDLSNNWESFYNNFNSKIVLLAMEYRNIANAYLSHRSIDNISNIDVSPIKDVNDMLIGDKVQNYKDFLLYHSLNHIRKNELDEYFNNWLKRLDINIDDFFETINELKSIEV